MRGEAATWWRGLQEGLAAWPRMLGTRLIVAVFVFWGACCACFRVCMWRCVTMLAEQAAVIEGRNGMSAPQRSFELTKGKIVGFFGDSAHCLWAGLCRGDWTVVAAGAFSGGQSVVCGSGDVCGA